MQQHLKIIYFKILKCSNVICTLKVFCLASGPNLGKRLHACVASERNRNQVHKYFGVYTSVTDPPAYIEEPFLNCSFTICLLYTEVQKVCSQAIHRKSNHKHPRLKCKVLELEGTSQTFRSSWIILGQKRKENSLQVISFCR